MPTARQRAGDYPRPQPAVGCPPAPAPAQPYSGGFTQPAPALATDQGPAPSRTNRRLLIVAAAILALAVGIAARPAISDALASDAVTSQAPSPSATSRPARTTRPAVPPAPTRTRKPHTTSPKPVLPGRPVQNFQSGTCLYAPGTTGELELWACAKAEPQQFRFPADGTLRVRGKCVTVADLANGAHLQLKICNGSANQQFSYNTSYDLVSGAANKCVDVPDSDAANGVPAQIWDCTGAGNQKWHY